MLSWCEALIQNNACLVCIGLLFFKYVFAFCFFLVDMGLDSKHSLNDWSWMFSTDWLTVVVCHSLRVIHKTPVPPPEDNRNICHSRLCSEWYLMNTVLKDCWIHYYSESNWSGEGFFCLFVDCCFCIFIQHSEGKLFLHSQTFNIVK